MKSSRPVNKVLSEANDELAILVTRSRQLAGLTQILRKQLDTNLAPHCYIGGIEKDKLTIIVDSAAWATKFRFLSAILIPNLKQAHHTFAQIEQIQLKILNPVAQPAEQEDFQRPTLNKQNAKGLETLADSVEDPELQAALSRLAKHAE